MNDRSAAALKAWVTRRLPHYKARKTARASQKALTAWAQENGFHILFLDAPSGNPRTGIVDAVMVRVGREDADQLDLRLVQLKSGSGGLTAAEQRRLSEACLKLKVSAALAFCDGEALEVIPKTLLEKERGRGRRK